MGDIKIAGKCKHCYALIGKDSSGKLVHLRHRRAACNGRDDQNGKVAVLKK